MATTKAKRKKAKSKTLAEHNGTMAATLREARKEYKNSNCGDPVALALRDAFYTKKDGLDLEGFLSCLRDNGCVVGKWAESGNRGAIRMTGGLVLRAQLRKAGKITIAGKVIK